jgi:hypothetical protein
MPLVVDPYARRIEEHSVYRHSFEAMALTLGGIQERCSLLETPITSSCAVPSAELTRISVFDRRGGGSIASLALGPCNGVGRAIKPR